MQRKLINGTTSAWRGSPTVWLPVSGFWLVLFNILRMTKLQDEDLLITCAAERVRGRPNIWKSKIKIPKDLTHWNNQAKLTKVHLKSGNWYFGFNKKVGEGGEGCWINSHSHKESWDPANCKPSVNWAFQGSGKGVQTGAMLTGLCPPCTCAYMSGACLVLLLALQANPHLEHLLLQFWVPIFKWQTGAHPE